MTLVNMDKYEEDAIFSCTPLFVLLEKKRAKYNPLRADSILQYCNGFSQ